MNKSRYAPLDMHPWGVHSMPMLRFTTAPHPTAYVSSILKF